tara:strand:+ start:933 stop:2654 length:1722 start_codon:yes stop_codon:yes gene_type:complete
MGILRADRVSGLGGANAINGSVKFASDAGAGQGTYLEVSDPDGDIKFGTSDWTIEFWMNASTIDTSAQENDLATILDFGYGIGSGASTAGAWFAVHQDDATLHLGFNNANQVQSSSFLTANTWHHIAITRTSNTAKIYGDGTQVATVSCSQDFTDATWRFLDIGSQPANGTERNFDGHISNLRIVKGTAIYTSAFTPPTTRLEKTSDTVLLCCQSPGNVFKEETGKSIAIGTVSKTPGPTASRFSPDIGEDHGTTFGESTRFNTLSYMVPPAGKTTQRNRGRGILFGGGSPGRTDRIDYIDIPSGGNSIDFGSLAAGSVFGSGAGASSTRGVFWAGENQYTKLDFVTIATTGNATSFGTSSNSNNGGTCMSSETRAVYTLGQAGNVMEYVTIASTGNTIDFGDQGIDDNLGRPAGLASPTRGIVSGGYGPSPYPQSNTIEYITIATTGNGQDFGDLTFGHSGHFGVSSTTRGVFAKGYTFPSPATTYYNTIEFITIASTGNATDFGDATNSVTQGYSHASHTRGVFAAGTAASDINTIDYVTIATTGNALDFGDTYSPCRGGSGTSDCHGGIS